MKYIVFNQADKKAFTARISNCEAIAPVDLKNGLSFISEDDFLKYKGLFKIKTINFESRKIIANEFIKNEQ